MKNTEITAWMNEQVITKGNKVIAVSLSDTAAAASEKMIKTITEFATVNGFSTIQTDEITE